MGVIWLPKQTFFNLDEEKRNLIIQVASEEFSSKTFEQASLTRIVERCGIAKGSMYQYFASKLDLYLYIVDLAYQEKRKYLADAFKAKNLFQMLEKYYLKSFLFAKEHPLFHGVANNFWDSRDLILNSELEANKLTRSEDFLNYLQEAKKSGLINEDLNPEAVFFVYHAVGKELINYFSKPFSKDFISDVLTVLKDGLSKRGESNES